MDAQPRTPTADDAATFPRAAPTIGWIEDDRPVSADDPGIVVLTCANCGAQMIERKCKLVCRCGYFLSCSDYY